jgi:hypothetical protein
MAFIPNMWKEDSRLFYRGEWGQFLKVDSSVRLLDYIITLVFWGSRALHASCVSTLFWNWNTYLFSLVMDRIQSFQFGTALLCSIDIYHSEIRKFSEWSVDYFTTLVLLGFCAVHASRVSIIFRSLNTYYSLWSQKSVWYAILQTHPCSF